MTRNGEQPHRKKRQMPITLRREAKDYVLHPAGGPYPSVLSEIHSHEGVDTAYGVKNRLRLTFQTSEKLRNHVEGIDDDRPMTVSAFVNATLSDKGRLMGFLAQQVPTAELDAELKSGQDVDIEALLIGTQWLLTIEHNDSGEKTYANISAAMKAPIEQQISIWDDDDDGF